MLNMKKKCEKCGTALAQDGAAYICSYECTFCERCTEALSAVCPNCSGELLRRPTRVKKPLEVLTHQVRSKLFPPK